MVFFLFIAKGDKPIMEFLLIGHPEGRFLTDKVRNRSKQGMSRNNEKNSY